jgi:hypothetical protein
MITAILGAGADRLDVCSRRFVGELKGIEVCSRPFGAAKY